MPDNENMLPSITVIIPVYNDTARLQLCLNALTKQTYPSEKIDILVVDNNSAVSCEEVVAKIPNATYLFEKDAGSYAARNKALAYDSLADVVAFTDSDCIPDSDWLSQAVAVLMRSTTIGAVGGRVDVFAANSSASLPELYDIVTGFDQKGYIQKEHFSVTANLVTRKDVLNAVGQFNAALKSSGDKDWCQRMVKSGYDLVYCDSAVVNHPARDSVKSIKTKLRRLYGGFYHNHKYVKKDKLFTPAGLLEALMPPVNYIRKMRSMSARLSLSTGKQIQLACFFYTMKLYTLGYRVRLMTGLAGKVERL
ncbi:glycosyltransferase [Alteromonas sp. H39]|uniref:glycosyltransferase n=1 Tax=Alteromonas sp. H39 TaxID=3389876 RepID=UPI0039DFB10A